MTTSDVLNQLADFRRSQSKTNRRLLAIEEARPTVEKLFNCGTWLHLREFFEEGETRLRNANFCKKHVLCRACASRRAVKLILAYAAKIQAVLEENGDLIPAMVTLTTRNQEDMQERLRHLKNAWSKMLKAKRQHCSRPEKQPAVEWNKVQGSLRSIEATNKGKGWHVHAHCFVLISEYIDQKRLSEEWLRFTGDSYVVGVTKCKNGIAEGLVEVLKYSTKNFDLAPEDLWTAFTTLKGSRLVDPQGNLRGVPDPEIDEDDISDLEGPSRDYIALWSAFKDHYSVFEADSEGLISPYEDLAAEGPPRPITH